MGTMPFAISGAFPGPAGAGRGRSCDLRARPAKEIARGVKQLTLVRAPASHIEAHDKGIGAIEGMMFSKNLWDRSVPRVELDQRARDARLRLDLIERLALPPVGEMPGSFGPQSINPSTSSESKR